MIAETRIPLVLGDKEYMLYFDANTMTAYEEASGKFFLETLAQIFEAMKPYRAAKAAAEAAKIANPDAEVTLSEELRNPLLIFKGVGIKDLQTLIWAALHTYSADDEPSWPLTRNQVGRQITLLDIPRIFTAFLKGQVANAPSAAEMGESPAHPKAPSAVRSIPSNVTDSGGERSIVLPEDAFA